MRRVLIAALILLCVVPRAFAWGDRGHQLVAYLAYMHLDPAVKVKVDALIKLNPCYKEWKATVSTLPAAQQSTGLFMLAATWPDKIKLVAPIDKNPYDCQPNLTFIKTDGAKGASGRFSVDVAPDVPEASQNIGYRDDRRHQYWHFIDTPLDEDGVATTPPGKANVLTEVTLLAAALASGEAKTLASYDLVWLEHLTGDIHQPLHDTQRFSTAFPNGDAGGNLVKICPGDRDCRSELHGYWDDLPGSAGSIKAVMTQGAALNKGAAPSAAVIDLDHPEKWVADAFAMAQADVYTAPFTPEGKVVDPSLMVPDYHNTAIADMQKQIFIAGWRLAGLLNRSLAS